MISSGSPPNGNPKPPPSMRASLATMRLDEDRPEDREPADPQAWCVGRDLAGRSFVHGAEYGEDRRFDLYMLRHGHEDRREQREDRERGLTAGQLRLTKIEPHRCQERDHDVPLPERAPAGAADRREHADEPAPAEVYG